MEYEYSFNVTGIDKYLEYCKKNGYELKNHVTQTRTIYRNKNKTNARITIEKGKTTIKLLDFKEDKQNKDDLNIRKESKAIRFNNLKNCENILEFLNYKKDNTLIRERYIYVLKEVKFEIDHYSKPYDAFVVAIEGEKKQVDTVYKELLPLNRKYKINS